jgi:integrase
MSKVTIRFKQITGDRETIYLDYYPAINNPATGKPTRREFLGLYLYNEVKHKEELYKDSKGKEQRRFVAEIDSKGNQKRNKLSEVNRQHNKDMMALAEQIRAKRQLSISSNNYGFLSQEKQNTGFVEYFEALANKKAGSNSDNWKSALLYLKEYVGGEVPFKDVDENFANGFKEYLLTAPRRKNEKVTLKKNSAVAYFNKFKSALKQAHKDEYLEKDLNAKIKRIKEEETQRQFLTLEELTKLSQTECSIPVLKSAAIFSGLTALRFSDIEKLKWGEIEHSEAEGYYIRFRQKKTKGFETLPISDEAYSLLGERGDHEEKVFPDLKYGYTQTELPRWLKKAGIKKKCTFHSFRHTCATLLLNAGVDLFVVSEMLGHREIKVTKIYAKILNSRKIEAANKIKLGLID